MKKRKGDRRGAASSGMVSDGAGHARYKSREKIEQVLRHPSVPLEEIEARLRANGATLKEHADALDATSAVDRAYFEKHPGTNEYLRPLTAAEIMLCWAPPGWVVTGGMTHVLQLHPGVRLRRQIRIDSEPIRRAS